MASSSSSVPPESDNAVASSSSTTLETPLVTAEESHLSEQRSGRQDAAAIIDERSSLSSREDPTEKIARGIASVLGPVVKLFETRVEEVLKSQSTLEGSIDRLTRELDKLLEDTPLPLAAQHAAKLSGIRKRMGSLIEALQVIQGRIVVMDHMLSKENVGSLS